MRLRKKPPSQKSTIRKKAAGKSSRETITAFLNPMVRASALKKALNSAFREKIGLSVMRPFAPSVHLNAFRWPKNANPKVRKGAPYCRRILGARRRQGAFTT